MKKLSRKDIAADVMLRVISMIEQRSSDPWPDHLWPAAFEVCEMITDFLRDSDPHLLSIEAIEERLDREGDGICRALDSDRKIAQAYQSLGDAYFELFNDFEAVSKELAKVRDELKDSSLGGGL